MHLETLREIQRECAVTYLPALATRCRDRYLRAAKLVELDNPAVVQVQAIGFGGPASVWRLLPSYRVICERYNQCFFSPQENLIANPKYEEDAKWYRYFWYSLVPELIDRDEVVRNVLRAIQGIPCADPEAASLALKHTAQEMIMPVPESEKYSEAVFIP